MRGEQLSYSMLQFEPRSILNVIPTAKENEKKVNAIIDGILSS